MSSQSTVRPLSRRVLISSTVSEPALSPVSVESSARRRVKSYVARMRDSSGLRRPSFVAFSGSSPVRRANAGWVASTPESSTAQHSVRQERLNRRVAASALTVTRERQIAGRAGRLRFTAHSERGRPESRSRSFIKSAVVSTRSA